MDKEQEIRLQFLEEAQEYLGTIETVFLNVANLKEPEQLNAMLRAAHSIKGGAAMMGYAALSQLAHRFEDFCKVIKVRYTSSLMDTDLESLLLNAVDGMNQVVALYRKGQEPDGAWLGRGVGLVFDRIHERLGDPQAEDDAALLMEETGQDMVALLFESGVDGGLQRLESILATPGQPCLLEESLILAQELGGLGEMLQLQGFVALCADIAHQLQRTPDQAETIARQALHSWRECQSLVLAGQLHCLPDRLVLPESPPDLTVFSLGDTWTGPSALTSPTDDLEEMILQLTGHSLPETEDSFDLRDLLHEDEFGLDPLDLLADDDDDLDTLIDHLDTLTIPNPQLSLRETPEPLPPNPQSPAPTPQPPPPDFLPPRKTAASSESQDFRESTVRVAVRQLDQLNDLFGELTIERNGLSLHLGRLQQLMGALAQRVRTLEQANTRLRTEYDRITVQSERSTPQVMANGARFIQPLIPSPSITEKGSAPTVPSLIYQFDALELDRYSDLNLLSQEVMETIVQVQEVTSDLQLTLEDAGRANHHLNRTAKEMQVRLTQARMRPLSDILNRFPRALREMAVQYGKRVELKIYGGNTLVDRKVLEALSDPLMHLLRNCFDHGIESPDVRKAAQKPEQGTIEIRAAHRGNQTIVILRDDGRGINVEKIKASALRKGFDSAQLETATEQELLNLIFEPGFSTVEQVTELSGRGVGMDVVRANLKRVRGDIRIDTQPGQGTAFTLSVPLTLSVIRVLLVESGGMLLAFPKDAIEEVLLPTVHQLVIEEGQPWLQLEDERLPLLNLRQWLAFQGLFRAVEMEGTPTIATPFVLVIEESNHFAGVQVDRGWGEQEVTVRQVEGMIPLPRGFAGCTILGNGRVVPLVDGAMLLQRIRAAQETENTQGRSTAKPALAPASVSPKFTEPSQQIPTVLVIDDSVVVRRFLALTLEKAGYRVEQAKDGQEALDKLLGGLKVQAITCDVEMPRLDGYGFLERLKAEPRLKHIPVSMITSRSGQKHRDLAMNLGASAYFSKPYQEQDLLQTLRSQVSHSNGI